MILLGCVLCLAKVPTLWSMYCACSRRTMLKIDPGFFPKKCIHPIREPSIATDLSYRCVTVPFARHRISTTCLAPKQSSKMCGPSISRSSKMATSSLLSSMRTLSLGHHSCKSATTAGAAATRTSMMLRPSTRQQPVRAMSQVITRATMRPKTIGSTVATTAAKALQPKIQQQTRGMKVHSSVKRRCEHCKVRVFPWAVSVVAVVPFQTSRM